MTVENKTGKRSENRIESPTKLGDTVRIVCRSSKYRGVVGKIFQMNSTGYFIVDMPRGTEMRIEGIRENNIQLELKRAKRKRGKPKPEGDPQWFPIEWLEIMSKG